MPTSTVNIRVLQAPLKARYQEAPEAASITLRVKSAASDLSDPLHCAITPAADPELIWRSGAHPGVGGIGDVPVGFGSIRCETRATVKDDGRPERVQRLLENAERYCVVLNTLRSGVPVESEFSLEVR